MTGQVDDSHVHSTGKLGQQPATHRHEARRKREKGNDLGTRDDDDNIP